MPLSGVFRIFGRSTYRQEHIIFWRRVEGDIWAFWMGNRTNVSTIYITSIPNRLHDLQPSLKR
jgi:hypothetical protein